jgi:hypothetical protein
MTTIQRIITCRAFILNYFGKPVMKLNEDTEETIEESDSQEMEPHGITCKTIEIMKDEVAQRELKNSIMQNLDKLKGGWNNTRPILRIVLASYENYFWWYKVFVRISDGKISDCPAAKKMQAYKTASTQCQHSQIFICNLYMVSHVSSISCILFAHTST